MVESIASSAARGWWTFLARGILAIALAILVFTYPGLTALVLTFAFGAYVLLSGFAMIAAGSTFAQGHGSWFAFVLWGLLGVIAGITMLAQPGIGALALAYTVALFAIATGVLEIFGAVHVRDAMPNSWLLIVAGVVSVGVGIVVAASPGMGLAALAYTVGIYAAISGVSLIALSWRVKGLAA